MNDRVRFDEDSYDALNRAGIAWWTVQEVLQSRPRLRQHIGGVLRIVARARDGRWIVVALIEEADDEYLVVSARELEATEAIAVARMMEGGQR